MTIKVSVLQSVNPISINTSDFLDLRGGTGDLAESHERHASTWTRFSGGDLATTVPTVRAAVDHIHGMSIETIAFVVASAYLAGMVRHILCPGQQQLS